MAVGALAIRNTSSISSATMSKRESGHAMRVVILLTVPFSKRIGDEWLVASVSEVGDRSELTACASTEIQPGQGREHNSSMRL